MGGDVGGVQQDPRDTAAGRADRLIDVIDEPLSGAPLAVNEDPRLAAADRLPGPHDVDEYLHLRSISSGIASPTGLPSSSLPPASWTQASLANSMIRSGPDR